MRSHRLSILAAAAVVVLAAQAAQAQPATAPQPAAVPQPAAQPAASLTLAELDFLIQQAADAPARFSFQSLQLLLAKRAQATAGAPEPKAP